MNPNSLPGIGSVRTATPRSVLLTSEGAQYYPGGVIVNGAKSRDPLNTGDLDVLRPGILLGKITATGLYAPAIIGVTTAQYTSGATTLYVSAATATEIVRRIGSSGTFKIVRTATGYAGPVEATVTFSAVSTSTGAITVTSLGANAEAGCLIGANDGSYLPLGVLGDGYGIKVTDDDDVDINVSCPNMLIGGIVNSAQIINWPTTLFELQEWIRTTVRTAGNIIFSAYYEGDTELEGPTPTPTPT